MISGFKASDIGQYGIDDLSWWTNPFGTVDWLAPPVPLGALYDIFQPWRDPPARIGLPEIPDFAPTATAGYPTPAPVGVPEVPLQAPAEVIDPEYRPTATVFEDAPGGIYEVEREPTDWDWVYTQWEKQQAEAVVKAEEEQVIDWGQVAGTIVGGMLDPFGAGQATTNFLGIAAPSAAIPGPVSRAGPASMKIDPKTGKLVACHRRRRRRRLLTDGDFNDLMRISTLPNKDIVKIALAKAVGR